MAIGLKTKTRIPGKIFIFQLFLLKPYQIHFCVCLSLLLLAEFVIPLLNCFFRDFRDFRYFRVFDLAVSKRFLKFTYCTELVIWNWKIWEIFRIRIESESLSTRQKKPTTTAITTKRMEEKTGENTSKKGEGWRTYQIYRRLSVTGLQRWI